MQILPNEKNTALVLQDLDEELKAQCVTYVNKYRSREEMHYHECAELGLCTRGSGLFLSEHGISSFCQGSVTYMPPGVLHIAQSRDDAPSEWIFLFADVSGMEYRLSLTREIVAINPFCAELLRAVSLELKEKRDGYKYAYKRLMELLLLNLTRIAQSSAGVSIEGYQFRRIVPAVNYISQNYAETISVKQLAELCRMGETSFFRIFRQATGETPISYLSKLRVAAAETLLDSTDLSVTQIAYQVGFGDGSTFYRQFRKLKKSSPKDYRKKS